MSAEQPASQRVAREWMPLLGTPFAIRMDRLNEEWARKNHGQSLERLAQRSGLDITEAHAIASKRRYVKIDEQKAWTALLLAAEAPETNGPAPTDEQIQDVARKHGNPLLARCGDDLIRFVRKCLVLAPRADEPVAPSCIECGGPVQWRCSACAISSPDYAPREPADERQAFEAWWNEEFASATPQDASWKEAERCAWEVWQARAAIAPTQEPKP